MLLPTRSNLLIIGIVAQHSASKSTCTAYSVAHDYGISHVTARKELTTLEACGYLEVEDCITLRGFHRMRYRMTKKGFEFLRANMRDYTALYLEFLFSLCQWE